MTAAKAVVGSVERAETSRQGNEERFRAGGGSGPGLGEQTLRLCFSHVGGGGKGFASKAACARTCRLRAKNTKLCSQAPRRYDGWEQKIKAIGWLGILTDPLRSGESLTVSDWGY